MTECQRPGCARKVYGYGNLCATHAKRRKRNGHADQDAITRDRLRPHVDLVRAYVTRHGGEASWVKLEDLLAAVTKDAAGVVAEAQSGRPFHLAQASAAGELLRVVETAAPRAIIETVAAVAIMEHREPYAFRSDEAFLVQVARCFRGLSSATKHRRYSRVEGRVKTTQRELRLDVATALGRMLHTTLGVLGHRISEGDHTERQTRAVTTQAAYAALRPCHGPTASGDI